MYSVINDAIPVAESPFVDKSVYFPESRLLEENYKAIKTECLDIIAKYGGEARPWATIDPLQKEISRIGSWQMVVLKTFHTGLLVALSFHFSCAEFDMRSAALHTFCMIPHPQR